MVWQKSPEQGQQAQAAAQKARNNPYVRRIMEDEDLRQNITDAYASARKAYGRLSNGKSPTKQLFDDKKLQKELKSAAESIKDAGYALREPKKKKSGASASCCSSPSPAPAWRSRSARACAEAARRAVRRRGGVRVQLDDHRVDPSSSEAAGTTT